MDITWVKKDEEIPQRTWEGDKQSWSVWADMTGNEEWVERNAGIPLAIITTGLGKTSAYGLAHRLYALYGETLRLGVHREN